MKKIFSVIVLFILYSKFCIIFAQNKAFEYPVTGGRKTASLEVYKVELTDAALILYTDVYGSPGNWVQIASTSYLQGNTTGKKYKLIESKGFELDKRVTMPALGNVSFKLIFEPVDRSEQSVDFVEDPNDPNFRVTGIQLAKVSKKGFRCLLAGEVIENPGCSRLALIKHGSDLRTSNWISIPVRNGKFLYELYTDSEELYELVPWNEYSDGGWFTVPFFAEKGNIDFKIYSRDHKCRFTFLSNAPLNKEWIRFNDEVESLFIKPLTAEADSLKKLAPIETSEALLLRQQMEQEKDEEKRNEIYGKIRELYEANKAYTPVYAAFKEKSREKFIAKQAYILDYIKKSQSLNGFYMMKEYLRYPDADIAACADIFHSIYEKKYPDKSSTKEMKLYLAGKEIKVGNQFIDFSVPDLQGNMRVLSKEIKGKIALIDLWASWCGPCRELSEKMIPIYESYKDKGFTIIGVARERDNTKAMEKAIQQDGYPWLNLVELNDKHQIWMKYGVGNAGGRTFLVDRNGKILAIHPDEKQVQEILDELISSDK